MAWFWRRSVLCGLLRLQCDYTEWMNESCNPIWGTWSVPIININNNNTTNNNRNNNSNKKKKNNVNFHANYCTITPLFCYLIPFEGKASVFLSSVIRSTESTPHVPIPPLNVDLFSFASVWGLGLIVLLYFFFFAHFYTFMEM